MRRHHFMITFAGVLMAGLATQPAFAQDAAEADSQLAALIERGDVRPVPASADAAPVTPLSNPEEVEAGAVVEAMSAIAFMWHVYQTWHPELSDDAVLARIAETALELPEDVPAPMFAGDAEQLQQQIHGEFEAVSQLAADAQTKAEIILTVTQLVTGGLQSGPNDGGGGGQLVQGGHFGPDAFAYWEHHSAEAGVSALGPITAPEGSSNDQFAYATTGPWHTNDHGFMQQDIAVTEPRTATFGLLYNYVTMEYPAWVGEGFDDTFRATLTGPGGDLEFVTRESVDDSHFTSVPDLPLEGLEDDAGGQTGWVHVTSGEISLTPGTYRLRIEVQDKGDKIVDSAILVDRASLR